MDSETCGWVILIGGILFYAFLYYSQRAGIKSQRESHAASVQSRLPPGSGAFNVTYKSGHGGIDHYLRYYLKRSDLPGTLSIDEASIRFECPWTRTPQRFSISWDTVTSATVQEPTLGIGNPTLTIHLQGRAIYFQAEVATSIENLIDTFLEKHHLATARKLALEQSQIKARNLDQIPPASFETLIGTVFGKIGYSVIHTGRTGDGGIDLMCRSTSGQKVIVQCKRYRNKVGVQAVRDLYGTAIDAGATQAFLVTTSEFTAPARDWSHGKPITLIDRQSLAELLDRYRI